MRWTSRLAVLTIALGSAALAIVLFGVESRDDAYATYWVASQLVATGHLVNVNGAPIEQSSSLALVLVLAALSLVTKAPMPVLGLAVGLASLVLTILLSARTARRVRPGSEVACALVVAVAFPLVFWSTGGLETLLAAASVLWFALALEALVVAPTLGARTVVGYLAAAALVVTVRPDTMAVAVVVSLLVLGVAAARRSPSKRVARWTPDVALGRAGLAGGGVLGLAGMLTAFRLVVFHHPLPQPELAKEGGLSWFVTGFSYVFGSFPWWLWLTFLVLGAFGAAWCARSRSLLGLVLVALFCVGTGAMTFTRGDWMGGARLLAPYLAPGLVVMVLGACSLRAVWRRGALCVLVVLECVALVLVASGANWLSSSFSSVVGPSASAAFEVDEGSPFGARIATFSGTQPPLAWYTSWDYVSARDAIFLASATPVLRRLVREHRGHGPITIGSDQGGDVISTWQAEFPHELRFLDMDDVETDDFSGCRGLLATYGGDLITIEQWAHDAGGCAPALPDLYFALGSPFDDQGIARYFRVVSIASMSYLQRHTIGTARELGATEFLAERNGWRP